MTGDGGVDDITLASLVSGRYVRMLGTQRGTMYGYSLYELEVYGSGSSGGPEITVLGGGVSITDGDTTPSTADGTDFGSVSQGSPAVSHTFTVRNDGTAELTLEDMTVPTGYTVAEGLSSTLAPGASDTFTVRLDTTTTGTKAGEITFATNDSDENPFHFRITGTVNPAVANLALGKMAVASTSYPGFGPSNTTDGNLTSRWSSQFSDSEWIYVDLGAVYTINQVVLRWEAAYGRGYTIEVSSDAVVWSGVYSTTVGDGGVDDITLASPVSGRYVRMLGTQRGTMYGYSLWEFEVFG
jgi:endo-1,3(4)-beta-glucanase